MPSKEVRLLPRPTLDSRGPRAPGWGLLRGGPTRMVGETGLPALALAPPLPRPPSPKPPRESLSLGAGPGGGGMGRHRPAPAKVPPAWTPGASGLRAPVSVWGAHGGGAFQLLPNTPSISCPGCKSQPLPSQATSGLCPPPGPALTLVGTDGPCPARSEFGASCALSRAPCRGVRGASRA